MTTDDQATASRTDAGTGAADPEIEQEAAPPDTVRLRKDAPDKNATTGTAHRTRRLPADGRRSGSRGSTGDQAVRSDAPTSGVPAGSGDTVDSGTMDTDAVDTGTDAASADAPTGSAATAVDDEEATWQRFAPAELRPAGPVRRALAVAARIATHEWTVASVASVLLAVLMTWPTMRHPGSTIPQDIYDPLLQTWQIAWDGHALLTDPLHLWNSNAFYPEQDTLAYSDSLLGYAPFGLIGSGPVAALVRYNVLYVLAYALAFVGMYALCRQLGARRPGAAMAGAAFAYAPWRLAHGGHLNILSTGGIALALAMLARGHGFRLRRADRRAQVPVRARWGWVLGGWLVAAWQVTLGFGLGLPFGYVLGLVVLVGIGSWLVPATRRALVGWRGRSAAIPPVAAEPADAEPADAEPADAELADAHPAAGTDAAEQASGEVATGRTAEKIPTVPVGPGAVARSRFHPPVLLANLGGLVVFALTCLYMGLPYLRAVQAHPYARRGVAELAWFSPPWQGFFIAPEQSWLWGDAHAGARQSLPFQPEMTLLVGLVLLAFALLGLFVSVWSTRTRVLLAVGVTVSVVLAMGTRFPGGGWYTYLLLHDYLPAWDSIRTPGRLVVWTTLLLALLAAGAVSALGSRADEVALFRGRNPRRAGPGLRVLLAIPLVLVLLEGWNRTPHWEVPTEPAALHDLAGPVLILPTDQLTDERYMYWSTDGFPTMVNGGSGFQPTKQDEIRRATTAFPDQASVTYLRDLGVHTVVILRDNIGGTPYEHALTAPTDGLGLTRADSRSAVVFTLR